MKVFETKNIRNVGLLSHGGSGKTSLAEAMLYTGKATTRLCKVDDENSNFDYEPEEHKRRGSIQVTVGHVQWKQHKVNLIDTSGNSNFFGDTREATIAMDSALLLVSAADGVEVGTERCWDLVKEANLPVAFFINKLDRERSNFQSTVDGIKEKLSGSAVVVQLPIGSESGFKGIVDLVSLKAIEYKADESGQSAEVDIPADMADEVAVAREALMEGIAETQEELLDKYFEEGELSDEEIRAGLSTAMRSGEILPIFCGSAVKNVGVGSLLDHIVEGFPRPTDRARSAFKAGTDEPFEAPTGDSAPFSAYIFKTVVDPYAGQLSVMRVFSGTMPGDGHLYNATTGVKERYSAVNVLQGKKPESVASAHNGDIVTLAKLKEAKTRHTFSEEANAFEYKGLPPTPPSISFGLVAKTQADEAKLSAAIRRILDEDVSLKMGRDEQSKQFLISGLGDVHIETVVARMSRKFGVEVELQPPRVPYRETIRKKAEGIRGRHKKQTGGAGQFGDCTVDMSPNERGAGFEFIDNIVGGSIPRNFIPAVEKGFVEAMARGFLAGFPVVDIKVRLFDGSYHAVDSSETAFKMAGSIAFKEAMVKADACLLEPVMDLEIIVPDENMGDVMGDMNSRRGRVLGMEGKGGKQVIKAQAPLAEVLRYALDLRSMTHGRGMFSMEVSHYEVVPDHLTAKVIAAVEKNK